MVSFSCEGCGDVLTKKKLDPHRNQCWNATFTCLDCMVHFEGTSYRSHTSCMSEAQKYQGHLYRPEKETKKAKSEKRKSMNGGNSQAMVPKGAYVEDAPEGDDMNAIAVIDVPPRAPTPPPIPEALPENINVFDFLVSDATPKAVQGPDESKMLEHTTPHDSQYSQFSNGNGSRYLEYGYSYGHAPVEPGLDRFDSWHNLNESQQSNGMPPPFVTPAPKEHRKDKKEKRGIEKSDKKRKRNVEDLDMSSVKRPVSRDDLMVDAPMAGGRVLHSGLTGGLSKLITDNEFYDDRIDAGPTPISPLKRSKRDKDAKEGARDERRKSSYVSYGSKVSSSKASDDKHRRSRSPDRERRRDHDRRSRRDASYSSEDHSHVSRRKAIEYPDRPGFVQPTANNLIATYKSRAELFMSFVSKGPDSAGCSINKALKRYHREANIRTDEKEEEDKELWKSLRLRRNSRGEIVLFT